MSLSELIQTVSADLNVSIRLEPPYRNVDQLPLALQEFYSQCNGIRLPYMEIYQGSEVEPDFLPGWFCFGFDGYFSYCLCRDSVIDLWDHDSGLEPEASFSNVFELLRAAYRDEVEDSESKGKVLLTAVPENLRAAELVSALKAIDARSSGELLKALKNLPLTTTCKRRDGLRVVRALHAKGVSCELRIDA